MYLFVCMVRKYHTYYCTYHTDQRNGARNQARPGRGRADVSQQRGLHESAARLLRHIMADHASTWLRCAAHGARYGVLCAVSLYVRTVRHGSLCMCQCGMVCPVVVLVGTVPYIHTVPYSSRALLSLSGSRRSLSPSP